MLSLNIPPPPKNHIRQHSKTMKSEQKSTTTGGGFGKLVSDCPQHCHRIIAHGKNISVGFKKTQAEKLNIFFRPKEALDTAVKVRDAILLCNLLQLFCTYSIRFMGPHLLRDTELI